MEQTQAQAAIIKQKAKNKTEIFHLILQHGLRDLEISTFLEQMLNENMITFQYSPKIFNNSIMWLQAKPNQQYTQVNPQQNQNGFSYNHNIFQQQVQSQYTYENEFVLIYHNADTFQRDFISGDLQLEMTRLKKYKQSRLDQNKNSSFKVIVLFQSVSDALFNNQLTSNQSKARQTKQEKLFEISSRTGNDDPKVVNRTDYDKFLIELTITYEFDFIHLDSHLEVIEFLKEMHNTIVEKPHRKELSMYSRKGFRPGKKAHLSGFKDPLSITYISFLMCIPGVSENKAIALAKIYPTFSSLMEMLQNDKIDQKEKINRMKNVEVVASMGDKSKKMGKVAEKIYMTLRCAIPTQIIN
ncbi:UNKNOWN [Stylonychia lemnae]|uniref:Uncharacterized protein n=1 Tax=Stylonychia lemnae TaxID=5949 RepID=A0A077ZTT5_STYLE|nr:UNKNOWN [Stylonychia lemnae]|eukprot:CDW72735.1 UNKNOWN [Stylonychia lemnae]